MWLLETWKKQRSVLSGVKMTELTWQRVEQSVKRSKEVDLWQWIHYVKSRKALQDYVGHESLEDTWGVSCWEVHQHHYQVHLFCRQGLRVGKEVSHGAEFHMGMIGPWISRGLVASLNHNIDQESKIVLSSKVGVVEKGLTHKELWKWFTK